MAALGAGVTQSAALVAASGNAQVSVSSLAALVVAPLPSTRQSNVSLASALVVVSSATPQPRVSSSAALVVSRFGQVDHFENKAWTFDFDGHSFYVLQLGPIGTYVYDFNSKTWAQWRTCHLRLWNMFNGTRWNGINVAADLEFPFLYEIRPDLQTDEGYRPITRIVSGAFPIVGRDFVGCDIVYLTGSVGTPTEFPTDVELRFSDDQGATYSDAYLIPLDESNSEQQLSWRSLGQMKSPGRIFEIKDSGGLVRINALDVITQGEEDDE